MLNSSLFLLLRFKKKGAKQLSSLSFQFLAHLVCFQVILVLSLTCIHHVNCLCFHPVHTTGLSYCADLAFCPSDCLPHSNQSSPVNESVLMSFFCSESSSASFLIFAAACEVSLSLFLFFICCNNNALITLVPLCTCPRKDMVLVFP